MDGFFFFFFALVIAIKEKEKSKWGWLALMTKGKSERERNEFGDTLPHVFALHSGPCFKPGGSCLRGREEIK